MLIVYSTNYTRDRKQESDQHIKRPLLMRFPIIEHLPQASKSVSNLRQLRSAMLITSVGAVIIRRSPPAEFWVTDLGRTRIYDLNRVSIRVFPGFARGRLLFGGSDLLFFEIFTIITGHYRFTVLVLGVDRHRPFPNFEQCCQHLFGVTRIQIHALVVVL